MLEANLRKYRDCVGLMILNSQNKIFTGQRTDFISGAWQMPQGGIDEGESCVEAAFRELKEETFISKTSVKILAISKKWIKYDLPKDLVPKLWKGKFIGQRQRWFLMRFVGEDDEIDINTDKPEFSVWRWSDQRELVANIVQFKKKTYTSVLKEFSSHFQ